MNWKRLALAGALAALAAGPVWAQTDETWVPEPTTEEEAVIIEEPTASAEDFRMSEERDEPMLHVMAGGGVEGYMGDFRGQVNPGPGWSVVASGNATRALGFEVGYSGAANNLDAQVAGEGGATNGADLLRNGGHAAVTLSAPTPGIQPYALAGIGIDRYTVRGDTDAFGYEDDTSGNVPLGVGIRTGVGNFTADLRFNYDVLFQDDFAPVDSNAGDGRYSGLLHLGGRF